mgnify:CR=1 FL=1
MHDSGNACAYKPGRNNKMDDRKVSCGRNSILSRNFLVHSNNLPKNYKIIFTKNLKTTFLRAFLGTATSISVVLSFIHLPLATALAIIFLSPIMLTALSGPLLKEKVGWRRWVAVFAGFLGVLLIMRPSGGGDYFLYAIPIITALLATFRDLVTRSMKGGDSSASILFLSLIHI